MPSKRLLLPLIFLVTALVYLPVCGQHEFLGYDDGINITDNPYLRSFSAADLLHFWQAPYEKLYIPLTYTLWSVQAQLSRLLADNPAQPLDPHLFHTVNVLLHSASAALVLQLLRTLGAVPWAAAAGALLFAVHPLQVEAVAWATGFKDLLAGFWSLLALWQYTLGGQTQERPRRSRLHHGLALASFILALLSKPSAVSLPLLAAVIGLCELGQRRGRLLLTLAPWALAALPLVLMTRQAQPVTAPDVAVNLWQRLLVAGDAISFYLAKLVLPITLGPDYGRSPAIVLSQASIYLTGLLPYLCLAYLIWKRPQPLVTAASLFLAALLPVLGLIPFNFQQVSTVADRYLYLAMLGPAWAAARLLPRLPGRSKALCLIPLTLLIAKTMVEARHWQTPLAFCQHAVRVNPDSWFFYNELGNAYQAAHEKEKAIASLRKSIELKPDFELPYINLAVVFKESGQPEQAVDSYLQVLALNPTLANVHNDLAMVYQELGDRTRALQHLNQALALRPDYDKAYANLGILHTQAKDTPAALAAYKRALEINPAFGAVYINLGALYAQTGDREAAIRCYRQAIALLPDRAAAYNNLGLLYLEDGRGEEAIPLFTRATALEANSPLPWHNLGKALIAADRNAEAIAALRQALAVERGFAPAYNSLSAAYLRSGQYRLAVDAADQAQALGLADPQQLRAVQPYR